MRKLLLSLIASIVAMPSLGGCYKHVVRVEGRTGRSIEVHEPNLKEDEPVIDDKDQKLTTDQKVPSKKAEPE